jgi:hypothetical protein
MAIRQLPVVGRPTNPSAPLRKIAIAEVVAARLRDLRDGRIDEMDAAGIDIAVRSHTIGGVEGISDPTLAVSTARRVNDFLAAEVAGSGGRFGGFATIALQDVDEAVKELRRAVTDRNRVHQRKRPQKDLLRQRRGPLRPPQVSPRPQPPALMSLLRCRRQDNTATSGQPTSAVPMTRSARPVIPPLLVSSTRYQASRARSVATAAPDTAGRSPQGAEGPRRHAPAGQAIRAMKVTPAHSPCAGEPPTCSGFAATSTLAAPAAARISRPGIAARRSASAVAISQAPVTAKLVVITHGSAASRSVRVLTVLASQLKEGGCRAVATAHPPTRITSAAAADSTPHQGTGRPAATAGENRAASLPSGCLPAAFTTPIPSRSLAQGNYP